MAVKVVDGASRGRQTEVFQISFSQGQPLKVFSFLSGMATLSQFGVWGFMTVLSLPSVAKQSIC